ncbi:MAG TPA: T9SS type A sorting domain-containing protein [Ignavibacteria bacterium]
MRKIIITLLLLFTVFNLSYSQQKMSFSLDNARTSGGYFMYDLKVTVLAGQVWNVGAANIRVSFVSTPPGALIVKADTAGSVVNGNPNISTGNYSLSTTSVSGGAAIGLNIFTLISSGFYTFTPGTYLLGTLRWTITPPFSNAQMNFRNPPTQFSSVLYDGTNLLTYNTNFTTTDPVPTNENGLITEIPKEYNIYQNYPNPFNPTTKIKFDVPKLSFVILKIYDITGHEVATLANQQMEAGVFQFGWDATNFASGIYFARLDAGSYKHIIKMLMIK